MRIGIYDPYLDSLSGGEKYMLTAAACLSSSNDVTVFWDDVSIIKNAEKKLHIDLSNIRIKKNIFSSNIPFYKRVFETQKYDCLIILSDGSLPITLAAKTIVHFQFPVEWVKGNNVITKFKLSKIDKIICNSYFTKHFIDKKFNINSEILYPPCINSEDLRKTIENKINFEKKNIILTVGRYSRLSENGSIKKFEEMINTFKKMVNNGLQNWQFILAVSFLNENERFVDGLINKIDNYPIKIFKNCTYQELIQLYNKSKIYWHFTGYEEDLQKHPERAEHFGITTVEAIAHKVVPVVINAGGQPEIVEDNINGYLWENEEELIKKTKRLMIDDKLRKQMADIGLTKVKQFTVEKFCEELKQIVQ